MAIVAASVEEVVTLMLTDLEVVKVAGMRWLFVVLSGVGYQITST